MISAKHSGSLGDVIYSLPTLRSLAKLHGEKATLYLRPDVPDTIPAWAGHRQPTRMSKPQAIQLLPILQQQPYIEHAALYQGEEIQYDMDRFRDAEIDFSKGNIALYYSQVFPQAIPELHTPWLSIQPDTSYANTIIINRTQRYRQPVSYAFLAKLEPVVFMGMPEEYQAFERGIQYVPTTALQLAQAIAGCRLFIGNQSFAYSLAEAMKRPRLLETYTPCPNVRASGPGPAAEFTSQRTFELLARMLTTGG